MTSADNPSPHPHGEADEPEDDEIEDADDVERADPFVPGAGAGLAAPPVAPAAPRRPLPPKQKGWPREVVVLGMVLSGLFGALVMINLPRISPRAAAALGKPQSIELTLVATDRDGLACASATVIDGLRCGFDAAGKAWPDAGAPALTLQPYTTTDRKPVLAAGLWEDPALEKAKLPKSRFRARCDFTPAGEALAPRVRWTKGPFKDAAGTWRAGRVSNCAVLDG